MRSITVLSLSFLCLNALFYGCKSTGPQPPGPHRKMAVALRVIDPIKIDGQILEKSWRNALWISHDHVLLRRTAPLEASQVAFLWDDVYLYFAAKVKDEETTYRYKGKDQPVWREDCIELFIDPFRKGNYYYELDFGAGGANWDSIVYRVKDRQMPSVIEKGWTPESLQYKVFYTDHGWQLEGRIRFDDMNAADTIPPHHGDCWHLNTYRINQPKTGRSTLTSWSPTNAFHNPDNFGILTFNFPERSLITANREVAALKFYKSKTSDQLQNAAIPIKSITVFDPRNGIYKFDTEKQMWHNKDGSNYVALSDEGDVPGVMEVKTYDRPVSMTLKAKKDLTLKLLIRNTNKSADFVRRGLADGTVTNLQVDVLQAEIYSYQAKWQLIGLQLKKGQRLMITVGPGPADNKTLDRTLIGIYVNSLKP